MFKWFRTMWLTSEERKLLKKAIKEKMDIQTDIQTDIPLSPSNLPVMISEEDIRPYKSIIYSPLSKSVVVVFNDGVSIQADNISRDLINKIKSLPTQEEIENTLFPEKLHTEQLRNDNSLEVVYSAEEKEIVKDGLYILRQSNEFEIDNQNNVYLLPSKIPLPPMVCSTFIEILEKIAGTDDNGTIVEMTKYFNALKMFWLKLSTNPLPESVRDTLIFVKKNDVHISVRGNMVLYRRIVTQGQKVDKALIEFVTTSYVKVKKWKKSPKNYNIYNDGSGFEMISVDKQNHGANGFIGNLGDMYNNLDDYTENNYTSYHNRGRHTIKIGGIYSIDDSQIDLDNKVCAAGGLHAACVNYNYSGYGDTPVVVLVNPAKAITVPIGDIGKLRTTEMFVACVNDKPHGVHFDEDGLSVFDEEYHELTLSEIEEAVKNNDYKPISIKKKAPSISIVDLKEIKKALEGRINEVV